MNNIGAFFLSFLLGYMVAIAIVKPILSMLKEQSFVAKNFAGIDIPIGAGLVLVVGIVISSLVWHTVIGSLSINFIYLLVGINLMALLGLIDDLAGDKTNKGLKGHLKLLLQGKLSTGGLKALGGGFIALFLSLPYSNSIPILILNAVIIALAINFINLLDLRPGRAIKGFLFFIAMIIVAKGMAEASWLGLVIGVVIAYLPYDLKAVSMLGDTGSNVLGIILGATMIFSLGPYEKLIALAALVIVHIYAEYYSISKLIEGTSFLRILDRFGRPLR
ncbi:MAG: UDP-N-acetylmuramyl pentapeptide phosphotransferase [Bacillota bacterium]|nr:UDP-N-acetylmuramyl pentapeptide phosphotransferase [Bacillota bacterium]